MAFAVFIKTGALWSSKAEERKQPKVKAAITLSVNAKIVFARDKNVFIFENYVPATLSLPEVNVSSRNVEIVCHCEYPVYHILLGSAFLARWPWSEPFIDIYEALYMKGSDHDIWYFETSNPWYAIQLLHTYSALRGPGFGSKPGPSRSPRAGPGRAGPGRAGPVHNFAGRAGPGPTYCGPRSGLGWKQFKHIELGPGLGLVWAGRTGPGLGLDIIKIFIQNTDYYFIF